MNPLQRAVKALPDVFIEIMPGILAAVLLTGLSSVLGNLKFVESNATLYGISTLINISSGAIFGFLPLCVAYSTVKRFGGRPIIDWLWAALCCPAVWRMPTPQPRERLR